MLRPLLLPLAVLATVAFGATLAAQDRTQGLFSEKVPVKAGDHCIVCQAKLQPGDIVYLVDGQRVGVKAEMEAELLAHPEAYLSSLKPRGWFAATGDPSAGQPFYGWLAFGGYMLLGLVFAAICTARAVDWGRPAAPWLLAGLFGNVIAFAVLLSKTREGGTRSSGMLAKHAATSRPLGCPECGGQVHPSANRCMTCGAELEPASPSESARASAS